MPADCLLALIIAVGGRSPTYAVAEIPPEPLSAPATEFQLAIDEERGRVRLIGWGVLEGNHAQLTIALSEPFSRSREKQLLPQNFAFTKSGELEIVLDYDNNEALRRCVERCRRRLEKLAKSAGAVPPAIGMVIESISWRGYRSIPTKRLVALSEIKGVQIDDATPDPPRSRRKHARSG